MRTAAVICEFNPFHNGHARILAEARLAGADRVIALMSGDYVQRGEPAAFSRGSRAKMALTGGADAVLMLPVRVSTASAEGFAEGAVRILNSLNCVDMLVFGSESGDLPELEKCAALLAREDDNYKVKLREGLKKGLSFPRARALALPEFDGILAGPNDILAVEYLKALIRTGSGISPCAVRREGSGYLDTGISAYPSALALRRFFGTSEGRSHMEEVSGAVPEEVFRVIEEELREYGTLEADDFSDVLASALLETDSPSLLSGYEDVTESLANTFLNKRNEFVSFCGFAKVCASRSLTVTHVMRALLHVALKIRKSEGDGALYTQVLGFRGGSSDLIGKICRNAGIPVVMNPPRELPLLAEPVKSLYREDIRASELYRMIRARKSGKVSGSVPGEPLIKI